MIDGALLRAVSRSFFLTIRLLPGPVREPIALGYLLARTTDSVADTSGAEIERRVDVLRKIQAGERLPAGLSQLAEEQENPDEAELLRRWPELWDQLDRSPARGHLTWVLDHILRGQIFDLTRFPASSAPLSEPELDEYTFLVAGCVGEFWTRLCAERLPRFTRLPLEEMVARGVNYGKGLQLVNVLRDRRGDAAIGRIYVPDEAFEPAKQRAMRGLESGLKWVSGVDDARVRFACVAPARIGLETLARIEIDSGPVKISRSAVRWTLLRSLPALWSRTGG